MDVVAPYYFFDRKSDPERERELVRERRQLPAHEHRLFCARCRRVITTQDQRITVNGSHDHHCTNPHGLEFHIGCLGEARGCGASGAATMEYTWFHGYAWRMAHCAQCQTHLGWLFGSPTDSFYGLILDRLTTSNQ